MSTTLSATPPAALQESLPCARLIRHEASLRAVGDCFVLAALIAVLLVLGGALGSGPVFAMSPLPCAACAGFAGFMAWTGLGLRRFTPPARICTAALGCLCMLVVPFGTLIGGYLLHLLYGKEGKQVFAPAYREVIAEAPHAHPRVSRIAALIGIALLIGFTGAHLAYWLVARP